MVILSDVKSSTRHTVSAIVIDAPPVPSQWKRVPIMPREVVLVYVNEGDYWRVKWVTVHGYLAKHGLTVDNKAAFHWGPRLDKDRDTMASLSKMPKWLAEIVEEYEPRNMEEYLPTPHPTVLTMPTCDDCGEARADVQQTVCPFAYEVNGEEVSVVLCADCYEGRALDV
jgi:hypothetical protein